MKSNWHFTGIHTDHPTAKHIHCLASGPGGYLPCSGLIQDMRTPEETTVTPTHTILCPLSLPLPWVGLSSFPGTDS